MPTSRSRIEDIRRHELIEAAYQTFLDHGLNGLTMARISKRSGLSTGIINYYFKSKNDLIFAFVRKAYFRTLTDTARMLRTARSPRERVDAIIAAHLSERIFTIESSKAWIGFYAFLDKRPDLARLHRVFDRRVISNLVHALSALVPREEAQSIAISIVVLIDGLWVRRATDMTELSPAQAMMITGQAVDVMLEAALRKERNHD